MLGSSFGCPSVEDPNRKPAVLAGFRGGRYISAEASARGEWKSGGSSKPGFDAYATSKQANLAVAMAFSRETSRLRFNAIEPGFNPTTGLGGSDAGAGVSTLKTLIIPMLVPILKPFMKILRNSQQSARVITNIMTNDLVKTGVYFNESGDPMLGSVLVTDPKFQDRVMAETRALLNHA